MSQYDNSNSGAIFENDKQGNEKRPDMTGFMEINVEDYVAEDGVVKIAIAGWSRVSKAGKPYYSLKFSPKKETK